MSSSKPSAAQVILRDHYVPATDPKWRLDAFLKTLKLHQYHEALTEYGVDNDFPHSLCEVDEVEGFDEIGVVKPLHRKRLRDAIAVVMRELGFGECV